MDATFSLVCRCPQTGWLGVAVATARPAVGNRVPWVAGGVGAVATQADTNPLLGRLILTALNRDISVEEALEQSLEADPDRERRQVAVLDRDGRTAVFTGREVLAENPWAGALQGDNCLVQGNQLTGEGVLLAMRETFSRNDGPLPERMLAALTAGQQAGGDKRGKVSAAILVCGSDPIPLVDLRVDLDADPVARLAEVYEAYCQVFPLPEV